MALVVIECQPFKISFFRGKLSNQSLFSPNYPFRDSTALRSLFFRQFHLQTTVQTGPVWQLSIRHRNLAVKWDPMSIVVDLRGKIPTFVPGYDGYLMGSTLLWLLLYCCWLATKKCVATPEPNRRGSQRSPRLFCKDVREPGKACGFGIDHVYRRDSVHVYVIFNFRDSHVELRSTTDAN